MVFDFTPEQIGQCPVCGKDIIEGKRGFGCSGYKEGCTFVVWKEQYGKELSSSQVGRLLKGETLSLKGFVKQDGTKFDGKLKLVEAPEDKHLYRVECDEAKPSDGKKKKTTKKDDAPE
jgi:DNA topoisomerase-3